MPAQVQVARCQITGNVASDSGGGIYMLSGVIGLVVRLRHMHMSHRHMPYVPKTFSEEH